MYLVFHFSDGSSSRVALISQYSSYTLDSDSPYCLFEQQDSCFTPLMNGVARIRTEKFNQDFSGSISDSLKVLYDQVEREYGDKKYGMVE
jgi:hypothetical protein